jgi:glyoxylate utilization-related uncharacterized protein
MITDDLKDPEVYRTDATLPRARFRVEKPAPFYSKVAVAVFFAYLIGVVASFVHYCVRGLP